MGENITAFWWSASEFQVAIISDCIFVNQERLVSHWFLHGYISTLYKHPLLDQYWNMLQWCGAPPPPPKRNYFVWNGTEQVSSSLSWPGLSLVHTLKKRGGELIWMKPTKSDSILWYPSRFTPPHRRLRVISRWEWRQQNSSSQTDSWNKLLEDFYYKVTKWCVGSMAWLAEAVSYHCSHSSFKLMAWTSRFLRSPNNSLDQTAPEHQWPSPSSTKPAPSHQSCCPWPSAPVPVQYNPGKTRLSYWISTDCILIVLPSICCVVLTVYFTWIINYCYINI